jgi:hypothetical protein
MAQTHMAATDGESPERNLLVRRDPLAYLAATDTGVDSRRYALGHFAPSWLSHRVRAVRNGEHTGGERRRYPGNAPRRRKRALGTRASTTVALAFLGDIRAKEEGSLATDCACQRSMCRARWQQACGVLRVDLTCGRVRGLMWGHRCSDRLDRLSSVRFEVVSSTARLEAAGWSLKWRRGSSSSYANCAAARRPVLAA